MNTDYLVYTGSYTKNSNKGIHVLKFDPQTGELELLKGFTGLDNPSYLTINHGHTHLYAISEEAEGKVAAYKIDKATGDMTALNTQSTGGSFPCYVSINEEQNVLNISNYGGSVTLIKLENDGSLGEIIETVEHTGMGVSKERQDGPHCHSIIPVPNTNLCAVADLGTDMISLYDEQELTLKGEISTLPGSGPRHFAFHPSLSIMYVIQELSNTIAVFQLNEQGIPNTLLEVMTTLPDDFKDENTAADLHISHDGRFLYASNRGHDSLVTYKILDTGLLECIGFTSTEGNGPRNFYLLSEEGYLLTANENSHSITVFKMNEAGIPEFINQQIELASPVCIQMVQKDNK